MGVVPCSAYELTHRWSFNGSYSDSVGGVDATPEGGQKEEGLSFEDSPLGGRMVKMAYAGSGAGAWLNLGTGVLGAEDATVEIWARRNAFRSWSRIFDYGKEVSAFDTLFMSWCVADDSSEAVGLYRSRAARFDKQKTMHPYEDGTLKVSDRFVVKAGETMLASGTVDLADAEVVLEDPENLSTAFSFIKAPVGQSLEIVGTPAATGLPKGGKLVMGSGTGKIVKSGFYIVVR